MKHCIYYFKFVFILTFLLTSCEEESVPVKEEPVAVIPDNPNAGCTDVLAKNYKSTATVEDCSCDYDFNSQIATTTPSSFLRRTMIEEHTGTWCGWCPMAKEVMEDMIVDPQVIGVEIHFGDEMAELDAAYTPLRKIYGGVPFPSGMVNRQKSVLGTNIIISQEDWKVNSAEWLKKGNNSVGIALESKLTDNKLTVLSHVKFTEKTDKKLRLGVYLVEDKVAGYPQLNYLSNYQQFKKWRAYSKPAEIADILHYNVVRDALVSVTKGMEIPTAALNDGKVFRKLFVTELPPSVKVRVNVKAVVFVMNEDLEIITVREVNVNQRRDWE